MNPWDKTWNPVVGCPPKVLSEPLKWYKPQTVLVANKEDLFSELTSKEWVAAIFGVMAASPQGRAWQS